MKLNNQGFSLIGVVIAAGLGMVLMTAFAAAYQSNLRMTRHLESKLESMNLKQQLMLILNSTTSCNNSMVPGMPLNVADTLNAEYSDITSVLSAQTEANLLKALVGSYQINNRYLEITQVQLFKPLKKMDGTANTSTPYEFQLKMAVKEKGGLGLSMIVDGPSVSLKVSDGVVSSDPCSTAASRITSSSSGETAIRGLPTCKTVSSTAPGNGIAIAYCPEGYISTGGGCSGFSPAANSVPQGTGWYCSNTSSHQGGVALAICCNP